MFCRIAMHRWRHDPDVLLRLYGHGPPGLGLKAHSRRRMCSAGPPELLAASIDKTSSSLGPTAARRPSHMMTAMPQDDRVKLNVELAMTLGTSSRRKWEGPLRTHCLTGTRELTRVCES